MFLTDADANTVVVLRDKDKDGKAEERFTFATHLLKAVRSHDDFVARGGPGRSGTLESRLSWSHTRRDNI